MIADADSQDIELDSRDLTWLEDAARLTDRIDELEAELANSGGFMVKGVAGQPVINPIIPEVRQTRALRAQLLARIVVAAPEEKPGSLFAVGASQHRDAANRRWKKA